MSITYVQWKSNFKPENSISTTPAGLHVKKSERSIPIVNRKLSATKAALSYILPPILEKQMLTRKYLARFWDLAQNLPVTA